MIIRISKMVEWVFSSITSNCPLVNLSPNLEVKATILGINEQEICGCFSNAFIFIYYSPKLFLPVNFSILNVESLAIVSLKKHSKIELMPILCKQRKQ